MPPGANPTASGFFLLIIMSLYLCASVYQLAIRRRGRVGIDHREEVVALERHVSSPGKHVVPGRCCFWLLRLQGSTDCAENQCEDEQETRHPGLSQHSKDFTLTARKYLRPVQSGFTLDVVRPSP